MEQSTTTQLAHHFRTLPKEVQEMILTLDSRSVLDRIPEFEPLQDVQKNVIENEITMIFLGLADIAEFTTIIKHNAEITRDRAEKIAKGVQQNIFYPNVRVLELVFGLHNNQKEMSQHSTKDIVVPQKAQAAPSKFTPPPSPQAAAPKAPDPLDIFKKRLETPIHTATTEEKVVVHDQAQAPSNALRGEANLNPSTKEHIAKDPYKETID